MVIDGGIQHSDHSEHQIASKHEMAFDGPLTSLLLPLSFRAFFISLS